MHLSIYSAVHCDLSDQDNKSTVDFENAIEMGCKMRGPTVDLSMEPAHEIEPILAALLQHTTPGDHIDESSLAADAFPRPNRLSSGLARFPSADSVCSAGMDPKALRRS